MTDFTDVSFVNWIVSGFSFWGMAIKSSIVIALTVVACSLLKRQSAAVRHRILVFGLAAAVVVPLASQLLPQLTVCSLPEIVGAPEILGPEANSLTSNAAGPSPDPEAVVATNSAVPRPEHDHSSSLPPHVDGSEVAERAERRSAAFPGRIDVELWLIRGWLIGMALWSTVHVMLWTRQSIRLSRLRRIDDDDWVTAVTYAAKALGLQRWVVTLQSDDACVPAVVGVFRPQLVVPSDWRSWNQTQRHCILLHELAHVERRDVATQLIGRLALIAHWFNPLVWHSVRRLRAERELACDDSVVLAGQTASDYAEQLLQTLRRYRPVRPLMGVAMAHSARLDQRVMAILDPQRRRDPVGFHFAIMLSCIAGTVCVALAGVTISPTVAFAAALPESEVDAPAKNAEPVWKENYTIEYPGTLPVSVAFSPDGQILLTGDSSGELMALVFKGDSALWRWKAKVSGSHAAVAFSADQKKVYATTEHGVRILDAAHGREEHNIEEKDSHPTALAVFPEKKITDDYSRLQIVFGTPHGYFVKSWAKGHLPNTVGTIQTTTVKEGQDPPDEAAVPLAVDPKGRSAIMTGPIDGTGQVTGRKGKNVLWAYVCGDYDDGSPGNRVMVGHSAPVISAAWAKEGSTAITGDAAGRVIVWDAATMKESSRLELGGRVAALAISDDGARTAACVPGDHGKVFVWETANSPDVLKPIHTELSDFSGPTSYASLSFSPDGRRLAGCAMDRKWLNRLGELVGKVRVWELAANTGVQPPP